MGVNIGVIIRNQTYHGVFSENQGDRSVLWDSAAPAEGPVEWYLLTTVKVGSAREAADSVGHYLQLWCIKDYFRVL